MYSRLKGRRVVVAYARLGAGRLQVFAQHQPARLLQPELLLELQRAQRCDGLEALVETRPAHPQVAR
jgi:hypothetical protein